jgi:hypothetical protein
MLKNIEYIEGIHMGFAWKKLASFEFGMRKT